MDEPKSYVVEFKCPVCNRSCKVNFVGAVIKGVLRYRCCCGQELISEEED